MHFTLWPSLVSKTGAHAEIDWPTLIGFLTQPNTDAKAKNELEGWSPAKFKDNRRLAAAVESVSCIVLDDDATGWDLDRVRAVWGHVAGAVHSSWSHTAAAPKWRIVLRCSRDMTRDEHARVWAWVRDGASEVGQQIDEATKDASRFWYVPARGPGGFEWAELHGAPLDVDAILHKAKVAEAREQVLVEHAPTLQKLASVERSELRARRAAMAAALGAAWPERGRRHEAQLALAGALRNEGWSADEALDFLCEVCRAAGDEDRAKRQKTIEHTWSRAPGEPLTGWTRLKSFVDGVVVDAARGALGRDASWNEAVERRLSEAASAGTADTVSTTEKKAFEDGPFRFRIGGLDAPLPALRYQIDTLLCRGEVAMLAAHGGSLKTWTALSIALSVASGRPWLGRYVSERGRVAIVDFESGAYELDRRLKMLGARDAELEDRLLRCSFPNVAMADPETWIALAEQKPELVVLDSFSAAQPTADENDARAAVLLQHSGRFSEVTKSTVVMIHHLNKSKGDDPRLSVRGSTAIFAACDRIYGFGDLENREDGRVRATMFSVKDGAGRRPSPVHLELSDSGLAWIEPPKEENDDASTADAIKMRILTLLSQNPSGITTRWLIESLPRAQREAAKQLLANMMIASQVVEYSNGRTKVLMLGPSQ